jgi:hypothetical protein
VCRRQQRRMATAEAGGEARAVAAAVAAAAAAAAAVEWRRRASRAWMEQRRRTQQLQRWHGAAGERNWRVLAAQAVTAGTPGHQVAAIRCTTLAVSSTDARSCCSGAMAVCALLERRIALALSVAQLALRSRSRTRPNVVSGNTAGRSRQQLGRESFARGYCVFYYAASQLHKNASILPMPHIPWWRDSNHLSPLVH